MPIYFLGVDKHKQPVYACIYREMYLVDSLKANMLVENDIIAPKSIMIHLANSTAFITSCNVRIAITAGQQGQPLRIKLMADITILLPMNSESLVPVAHSNLPADRDFFFQPVQQPHLTLFAHLISHDTKKVLLRNDSPNAVLTPRKHRLGTVTEVIYENCFPAVLNPETAEVPPRFTSDHFNRLAIAISSVNPSLKTKLANGVMIYGDKQDVQRIAVLVDGFPTIWDSSGFVDIPPEGWITVPLKDDWQAKLANI